MPCASCTHTRKLFPRLARSTTHQDLALAVESALQTYFVFEAIDYRIRSTGPYSGHKKDKLHLTELSGVYVAIRLVKWRFFFVLQGLNRRALEFFLDEDVLSSVSLTDEELDVVDVHYDDWKDVLIIDCDITDSWCPNTAKAKELLDKFVDELESFWADSVDFDKCAWKKSWVGRSDCYFVVKAASIHDVRCA